ncbi:MAG: VgrG-related protein [Kineosporiaceae bacterium]|nr:VgrG-related protein [Kineosporiaceae bacterium]
MPQPTFSSGFGVSINGTELSSLLLQQLVSGYVDDSLNLPDLVVLRFRDPDRLLLKATGASVGAPLVVSVSVTGRSAPQKLITAEITALEVEFDTTGSYTVVRGLDPAHRLFRGRRTDTWTQATASDVATKVAQRAGLTLGRIDSTSTVFDHVCQAGVSDWVFLNGLAREIGHEVAVRDGAFEFRAPRPAEDAPDGTAPAEEALVLRRSSDLLRLRAVVTAADQVSDVEVRGWDVAEKKALIGRHRAGTRSAQLDGATPADLAKTFGDPVYVTGDVPYRTQAEVDTAAQALSEQLGGAFAEVDAVARGNPMIRAGAAITLTDLGAPFDGKYVVTTSRHTFDQAGGYQTHFSVTGRQDRSLYGLVSGGGGNGTGIPPITGVTLAVVTDVQDPTNAGRVKVCFPWLADDHVSDWARTVHAGAGESRGAFILPEVGDEVLVAFERGDLRHPYVLGGLYNGRDTPPSGPAAVDSGSGAVTRRSVVSRRGHRIDLLDADSGAGVRLATGDDALELTLDASNTRITVTSNGSVEISGAQGISIKAGQGRLQLEGADISIKATTGLTLDGGAQATLKAALVRIN